MTIREAIQRAKREGLPVSEYSLRGWVKTGAIPVRNVGNKSLLYYPNLVSFLRCEHGADNASLRGIRRADSWKERNAHAKGVREDG